MSYRTQRQDILKIFEHNQDRVFTFKDIYLKVSTISMQLVEEILADLLQNNLIGKMTGDEDNVEVYQFNDGSYTPWKPSDERGKPNVGD